MEKTLAIVLVVIYAGGVWTNDRHPNGDVKLYDPKTPLGDNFVVGRVLVYLNETWGTVNTAGMTDFVGPGQAICRQLQYYDVFSAGTVKSYGIDPDEVSFGAILENLQCQRSPDPGNGVPHILRCSHDSLVPDNSTTNHNNDLAVNCIKNGPPYNTQLRLVQQGPEFTSSGYLEIYLDGSWGPVCNIGTVSADSACRQLGYTRSFNNMPLSDYEGNGTDKIDKFTCRKTSFPCLGSCFKSRAHNTTSCGSLHSYINCTFVESDDIPSAGSQAECSKFFRTNYIIATVILLVLSVTFTVAMVAVLSIYYYHRKNRRSGYKRVIAQETS